MQLCILHTAINNTENMIQMYLGFLINSEYCDKETAKKILNFSEIRNSPEFPGSIAYQIAYYGKLDLGCPTYFYKSTTHSISLSFLLSIPVGCKVVKPVPLGTVVAGKCLLSPAALNVLLQVGFR